VESVEEGYVVAEAVVVAGRTGRRHGPLVVVSPSGAVIPLSGAVESVARAVIPEAGPVSSGPVIPVAGAVPFWPVVAGPVASRAMGAITWSVPFRSVVPGPVPFGPMVAGGSSLGGTRTRMLAGRRHRSLTSARLRVHRGSEYHCHCEDERGHGLHHFFHFGFLLSVSFAKYLALRL